MIFQSFFSHISAFGRKFFQSRGGHLTTFVLLLDFGENTSGHLAEGASDQYFFDMCSTKHLQSQLHRQVVFFREHQGSHRDPIIFARELPGSLKQGSFSPELVSPSVFVCVNSREIRDAARQVFMHLQKKTYLIFPIRLFQDFYFSKTYFRFFGYIKNVNRIAGVL